MNITSNLTGMNAVRRLGTVYSSYADSINRISTGERINKSADDASGMTIADSLASQSSGMGQAIRNANDGISITQIADGALEEAVNLIDDIKTKSIQAASDSQSLQSRQALQADIEHSLNALDKIAETTSFNGQKLFSGDFINKQFQVGASSNETVEISIGAVNSGKLGSADSGSLADIDVTTFEGAAKAVEIADAALGQIDSFRSTIGSAENQLSSTINNLTNNQINLFSSESTIRDIDYAEEAMNMKQLDMLTQARLYATAQANASYKKAISFLTES